MGLNVGDIVTLSADAIYYTGKEMPGWVKNDRWIIKSVAGDRAVLGKNESGTHEINSPVNVKYLQVNGEKVATPVKAEATPTKTEVVNPSAQGEMKISQRGMELVARYEGCRLEAYKCPAGVWTIGYGHTAGVVPGQKLSSKKAAMELLKDDLNKYAASVNNCVKKGIITFPLNQNQFDALTSFCYNCGAGNLQRLVSGRSAAEVAEKLMAYTKAGGKVLPGLVRRREEERELFLS